MVIKVLSKVWISQANSRELFLKLIFKIKHILFIINLWLIYYQDGVTMDFINSFISFSIINENFIANNINNSINNNYIWLLKTKAYILWFRKYFTGQSVSVYN